MVAVPPVQEIVVLGVDEKLGAAAVGSASVGHRGHDFVGRAF